MTRLRLWITGISLCIIQSFLLVAENADGSANWQATGWGGGGFFWCCAFHPDNGNIIYLGGDVAGMYKTEDKGKTWRFINKEIANYCVYSIATAKNQPDRLYIMTEEGICRSDDAGEHWTYLKNTGKTGLNIVPKRHATVRGLAVSPRNAGVVYAGSATGKAYKSVDAGQTWKELKYYTPEKKEPVAYHGKGSLVLEFQSTQASWDRKGRCSLMLKGKDLTAYTRLTAWFYLPSDAPSIEGQFAIQTGDRWQWQEGPWVKGKPGQWVQITLDLQAIKHPENTRALYCVFRATEKAYTGPVYLDWVQAHAEADTQPLILGDWEKEGGLDNWRGSSKDMPLVKKVIQSTSYLQHPVSAPIASIVIDEQKPDEVYLCHTTAGIFHSKDGGNTWEQIYHKAAMNLALSDQYIFAACGKNGILRSADGGRSWQATGMLPAKASAREILVHPKDPSVIYCIVNSGWNGFFYKSVDAGATWTKEDRLRPDRLGNPTLPRESPRMSTLTNICFNPANPNELFISANWRNLYSADGGKTWEERARGADITCVTDLRFLNSKVYVTAMDEGLFVSEDNGKSWRQLAPLRYDPQWSGHMWRVAVNRINDSERIIATSSPWNVSPTDTPNRVIRSEDGGVTFHIVKQGLPTTLPKRDTMWGRGYPRALAVDPTDPQTLYLGIDGEPNPARKEEGGGIFKSTDGGKTWQRLPGQPAGRRMFYGLAVDPTNPQRIYWASCGTKGGVYRTEDGGKTWQRVFHSETWLFNLALSPSGIVYAGGNQLWKSADHGTTWKKISHFPPLRSHAGKTIGSSIVGIAIDPQNEKRLWISRVVWNNTAAGAILRSDDGGQTWQEITGDIPCRHPLVLRYNPQTRELWAAGPGIFRISQP